MPKGYTKVEILSEEMFRRKAAGETNREIAESYGLTLKQIKQLNRDFLFSYHHTSMFFMGIIGIYTTYYSYSVATLLKFLSF